MQKKKYTSAFIYRSDNWKTLDGKKKRDNVHGVETAPWRFGLSGVFCEAVMGGSKGHCGWIRSEVKFQKRVGFGFFLIFERGGAARDIEICL